ncbi:MAG: hypothetical protein AMXMBFR7_09710 [Planctomycetota bacterium]
MDSQSISKRWVVSGGAALALLVAGGVLLNGMLGERVARRQAEEQAATLQIQVNQQDAKLGEAARQEQQTSQRLEKFETELHALSAALRDQSVRHRNILDEVVSEKSNLMQRIETLEGELAAARTQATILQAELAGTSEDREKLAARLAVERETAAAQAARLRDESDRAQRQIKEAELELKRAQTKAVELETDLAKTANLAKNIDSANRRLSGELGQTQAQRDAAAWQAAQTGSALNDAQRHIDQHHRTEAHLRQQNQALSNQVFALQQEVERLKRLLASQAPRPTPAPVPQPAPGGGGRPGVPVGGRSLTDVARQ